MKDQRLHVYISGRVQGVFYRATTMRTAQALGLTGWVRNLPDGRVEAVFEGPRSVLEQALMFCYTGPPGAHVEDIEIDWTPATGEFDSFTGGAML
jgi:acylphosphatase